MTNYGSHHTAAILNIVDTQLRDGTPPETRQTFERLVVAGYSPEGARQLIAHVVREIFTVMACGEGYDQARFVAALHRLPMLSSDVASSVEPALEDASLTDE